MSENGEKYPSCVPKAGGHTLSPDCLFCQTNSFSVCYQIKQKKNIREAGNNHCSSEKWLSIIKIIAISFLWIDYCCLID